MSSFPIIETAISYKKRKIIKEFKIIFIFHGARKENKIYIFLNIKGSAVIFFLYNCPQILVRFEVTADTA